MANPDETRLMNMLTNVPNYDKRVRPVLQQSKPVFISHGVILKDISDIVSVE